MNSRKCYTYNLEIYESTLPEHSSKLNNSANEVVKRLPDKLENSERNITSRQLVH